MDFWSPQILYNMFQLNAARGNKSQLRKGTRHGFDRVESAHSFSREEFQDVETEVNGTDHLRGCHNAWKKRDVMILRPNDDVFHNSRRDEKLRARLPRRFRLFPMDDSPRADENFGYLTRDHPNRLKRRLGAKGDLSHRQTAVEQCLCQRSGILYRVNFKDRDDTDFVKVFEDSLAHSLF